MQSIKLSWRLSKREWRSGELRILLFALITAIAATTTISFFTERLKNALLAQSAELIGGDLVLRSSRPLAENWLHHGQEIGLETVELAEFGSVLMHAEKILLVSIKAVSQLYPIRGQLRVADSLYGDDYSIQEPPLAGEVWVDRRVMNRLNLALGAQVKIGRQSFKVTKVLTFEPDRGGNFFNLSPRVLMNHLDLNSTGVVQPGSRVRYGYLFAGAKIEEFAAWLKPQLGPGQKLLTVTSERGGASKALNNAEHYLRLISLMAIMLAAVAIAVATQRYSERHYHVSAMLRCFGATQRTIVNIYLGQLAIIACVAGLLGCFFGWVTQALLMSVLDELIPVGLPASGIRPIVTGFLAGLIILLGTALPPVLRLKNISPLRVIRRNLAPISARVWSVYLMAVVSICLLILLLSKDVWLTLIIFFVVAVIVLLLYLTIYILMRIKLHHRRSRRSLLGRGFASLSRHARSSAGQIIAFAVTMMLMLVIMLLRTELLDNWRTQLPENAPNHFAFNILPQEKDALQQWLVKKGVEAQPLYPMVRGRLTQVNGVSVKPQNERQDKTDEALNRELNLTWTDRLPDDNRIIEGRWLDGAHKQEIDKQEVSVELELARRLGLKLGDELEFNLGGEKLLADITSLRSVQWENFSPNFYMIFPPGTLDGMPTTYITSFRLHWQQGALLAELVSQFPSVTVLEVEVIIQQFRTVLRQVTMAVEIMLLFVLLAGFAVLFAAVQTSLDERLREGALMRALGARRQYLEQNNLIEFALLGFISGVLAVLGAEAINTYLYHQVFQIERQLVFKVWIMAPLVAAFLIALVGYFLTRRTITQSPKSILQQYE